MSVTLFFNSEIWRAYCELDFFLDVLDSTSERVFN